jgi:hypothetical protein
MLKDGVFVKEEPPTIGRCYVPKFREENCTPEERFVQDLLLGGGQDRQSILSRWFGLMLRM